MRPRQIKSRICGKKPAQSPAGHRLPAADPKMRRRPRLSAAFCLLCFLGMTGCTPGASVDTLLKPPSLSAEQQQIILDSAAETTPYQRSISREYDSEILAAIAESGNVISELTLEEKSAWQTAVEDAKIYDRVKATMKDPELFDALLG